MEKNTKSIRFSLFADLHYRQGMYMSFVEDMQGIVDRAGKNNADFILHCGDLCNDYAGSPELMKAYLENNRDIEVYGVYGNHELESSDNSMRLVTPMLTNRANNVVWGTEDGLIGDGSVGYYYFDKGIFRIICTDTNYSFDEKSEEWVHNATASYGPPAGNIRPNALGPVQLEWLEKVLEDAALKGKKCIVAGHAAFNTDWCDRSPDSDKVVELFKRVNGKKKGTVLMAVNGHYHTNRKGILDDVFYFDVNTVRNGLWRLCDAPHYTDEHTFKYIKYDSEGNIESEETAPLSALWQSKNTWYFKEPLSAVVTVSADGKISVEGAKTEWLYGVEPPAPKECQTPLIYTAEVQL